uniref:Uncharacterized protein n=1 Tax=Brassica oleracea TaxID=3712 RepID=A0A3P6GUG8_BRAOL|nr:unnamed protein product [Brassica oleracea]
MLQQLPPLVRNSSSLGCVLISHQWEVPPTSSHGSRGRSGLLGTS